MTYPLNPYHHSGVSLKDHRQIVVILKRKLSEILAKKREKVEGTSPNFHVEFQN